MTIPPRCRDIPQHGPHEWIGQALRYNCPGRNGDFVLAGTGSRSLRIADRAVLVDAMDRCTAAVAARKAEHGDRLVVMSGGAEGFDELVARVALRLGVRLWLALPNRGYLSYYWGRASLLERDRSAEAAELVAQAWKLTYVVEDVHGTSELKLDGKHANFWRNDFMIENADQFLVWDPSSKGTAHCLAGIKKAKLAYEVLSPKPATLPL